MIGGTQLFPHKKIYQSYENSESPFHHVILKNFKFKEFQFKGEILNSGFKIYRNEHNFMDKLFLLIECELSYEYKKSVDFLETKDMYD